MNAEEPDERWVCAVCIAEEFLRNSIEQEGTQQTCHYCAQIYACFSLEAVSNLTEKAIKAHFYRTPTEPNEMEYACLRHVDGYDWFRDGEDIVQLIVDLLQTRRKIADDIQQLLEYRHSDFDSDVIGLETEFARDACYAEHRKISTGRLDSMWRQFVTSLKSESRFINHAVNTTLDGIFRGVETMRAHGEVPVIIEAGPGTAIPSLYRARWSRNHTELEQVLVSPDRELGPPPPHLSGENRMSARGISVFYGASSVDTAISEIRPPVGCNAVCAKFSLIRSLRLLNLPALESVLDSGSLLDPEYIKRREQAAFLSTLTRRIVDPVLPGEEDFRYIPTQVIAEYLADSSRFDLDGILYPSVQLPGAGPEERYNVVLFHKASRVRLMTLPAKEDCMIRYGHQYDEDEWEPDICVTEIISSQDTGAPDADGREITDLSLQDDHREPALEIDLHSVSVHGIRAARFEYSTDSVRRSTHSYTPRSEPAGSVVPPWDLASGQDNFPF
ncbi:MULTISPECIES: RES family NAD+ phosphorylase [Pectobacterium]|uniref:RES family NAD+ phosphorylase n=1 Tax=Pectobacterium TaxID=122277 RepID=UPI000DC64760|nr:MULTISPECIES: RES family NAD+ phosphorylase [Pectobacterium]AZS59312.1 RES domain-containing protein [Pectobacterium parmentieri]